jgi:hypothetical protein
VETLFRALGKLLLGILFEEFWAFVSRLRAQRADDEQLDDMIGRLVREVATRGYLPDWQAKMAYASDQTMRWLGELGRDVERALVNTKIDHKVVAYREKGIIPS